MEKEMLVVDNMRLVYHIAKKFKNTGYEYDDLVQEGMVGLIKAAKTFDEGRGVLFSTQRRRRAVRYA